MEQFIPLIFWCIFLTVVKSEKVIKITANTSPLKQADVLIQRCTEEYNTTASLYYFQRENKLLFINKESTTLYEWEINTGNLNYKQINEIEEEDLILKIPFKHDGRKYIIGVKNSFRFLTRNSDDSYILSDVIAELPAKYINYTLYQANCDINGTLFVVANAYSQFGIQFNAKLYKLAGENITEMAMIPGKSHGFVFNFDNNYIYTLGNSGRVIYKMKYLRNTGTIDNKREVVFNITQTKYKCFIMTAITMDRNESLWVSASSKQGLVFKINPESKEIQRTIVLPTTDLTSMKFGQNNYQTLFVSSRATFVKAEGQGAIYAITGMDVEGVPDRPFIE